MLSSYRENWKFMFSKILRKFQISMATGYIFEKPNPRCKTRHWYPTSCQISGRSDQRLRRTRADKIWKEKKKKKLLRNTAITTSSGWHNNKKHMNNNMSPDYVWSDIIKISAIASNSICHPELTLKPQICWGKCNVSTSCTVCINLYTKCKLFKILHFLLPWQRQPFWKFLVPKIWRDT